MPETQYQHLPEAERREALADRELALSVARHKPRPLHLVLSLARSPIAGYR